MNNTADDGTDAEAAKIRDEVRERLKSTYGEYFIEDYYTVNHDVAEMLLKRDATLNVSLTTSMLRDLFFSNLHLHNGISALHRLIVDIAKGQADAAIRDESEALDLLRSSDSHFRKFVVDLLVSASERQK